MSHVVVAELVANVLSIEVAVGQRLAADDPVVVLESMKMEIPVLADVVGVVSEIVVAVGDVVTAAPDDDGRLWAQRRESTGGHGTIRVIPLLDGSLLGSTQALVSALSQSLVDLGPGVRWESAGPAYSLVALDLTPDLDATELARVRNWLEAGQADGAWEYEESCVTPAWLAL